jgi:hypothetical protein
MHVAGAPEVHGAMTTKEPRQKTVLHVLELGLTINATIDPMIRRRLSVIALQQLLFTLFLIVCGISVPARLAAQPCSTTNPPCVNTSQYNNSRTGYNGYETVLTSPNLQAGMGLTQLSP